MACLRDNFENGVVLDGRYQTLSPLNHGSFGMVFMAKQIDTGNTVAIKCLTKKAIADEAGIEFAIDDKSEELVLHRQLGRHPNIVNLIESFETEAHVYLVLEFCPRGDLYEAIRNSQGPLETEHVRRFMLELVDAVDYIHSKGIYHRDIKPENIFLSQSGTLKLGDFGLATTEEWTYETTVGSDRYMSPEQFDSDGAGYSPAHADIWAIGICLLNILFSRNPFNTPTENDPLFLDFSRDKQSLFDVFHSMSQDTFEVIVQCMNLDPKKRSLAGVREALRRVVSFTTLDEALDDFCSVDRRVVASANREPLRTPSIQSPQVECGSFPWAKALLTSRPQLTRQLSIIPDNDSYSEELFSKYDSTTDWCSNMTGETPSMESVLDSRLGTSMNSLAISQPRMIAQPKHTKTTMSGSLPIAVPSRPHAPAISLAFGHKDNVSKSWSDMWDEEAEEEAERLRELEKLNRSSTRTWNQDSDVSCGKKNKSCEKPNGKLDRLSSVVDDDNTPRVGLSPATKTLDTISAAPIERQSVPPFDENDDLEDDLFFSDPLAEEKHEEEHATFQSNQYLKNHAESGHPMVHLSLRFAHGLSTLTSDSKLASGFDKWEALGERRRAFAGMSSTLESNSHGLALSAERHFGDGLSCNLNSACGKGVSDLTRTIIHQATYSGHNTRGNQVSASHCFNSQAQSPSHGHVKWSTGKEGMKNRVKECPWNQGRDWNWGWRRDRRSGLNDVGWVGSWQEARS